MMPVNAPTRPPGVVLEAVLERLTYVNEETGYTVARVATARGGDDLLTVVGALLGAQPGESLRLVGRWSSHPQYGRQFEVDSYTTVLPATIQGIRRYLGSGLVKGIGPVFAERIVAHFDLDTLRVIEEEPGRLVDVPGLGPKRTAKITAAWAEQKAIKEVMLFLQTVGVSTSVAVRIFKQYADQSITVVQTEPYRLAADVWGIGFKTADTIAQAVEIPHESPQRIKAGLQHTLSQAADDGHCYLPRPKLIVDAAGILGVPAALIEPCLAELAGEEGVVCEELMTTAGPATAVFLVPFHRAETSLAGSLRQLLSGREDRMASFATTDWPAAFGWLRACTGTDLAVAQQEAVRLALTSKVAVLTGGPGCGKSFTVAAIVALARAKKAKIQLVAPTGRAAKRLAELAGQPAATIHRLLALRPGGDASYDRDNPLDVDLLVVDEASMLDLILANKLVKAVPPGAHLLLVGDVDQLPSVGAGQVLRDLLNAETVPRVRLTEVFRQAAQSGVVANAHRINAGRPPLTQGLPTSSCSPATTPTPPPNSPSTWPAAGSQPSSASTRGATSRSSPRCTADPPAPAP
jgi:exodeoxyribonuclease V alpha subunit